MAGDRRRRSRRSIYRRADRQFWLGIGFVGLLLTIAIALRVLSFVEPEDDQAAPDLIGERSEDPAERLRLAFSQRDLGRILLACHAAWDRQLGALVPALAIAWQADQIDVYAAEGSLQWRHYWCRENGVGRGRLSARPESINGHLPLASEQLVYRFSGLVADARLRALEALGDGRGQMQVRLHWQDGRVTGESPGQPAPDFPNVRMGSSAGAGAEAGPT